MPKVTINDSQGLVQSTGSGFEIGSSISMNSLPTTPISPLTSAATLSSPGVYTISGSAVVTMVMPLASSVPGGTFVFRTASAHAHVLTGSQEAAGTLVFAGSAGTSSNSGHGSRLTINAVQGSSVALISDGASFLLMAVSGSHTIAGT